MTGGLAARSARLREDPRFWRRLSAGLAVLSLALLVAAIVARPSPDFAARRIVAVVRNEAGQPVWAIRLAAASDQIAADALRPQPLPSGHVYQLWLTAEGAAAPRPVCLLPQSGRRILAVAPEIARLLQGPGALMVSVEPLGGSPRPGPSGPVQFRARLDPAAGR